jgi:hypothetical protein
MTDPSKAVLQIKFDDVVWRDVGDDLVVLELSTSTYLTLNGTAKFLWQGIADGGSTKSELAIRLSNRYDIPEEQAVADVESFLGGLSERRLLVGDD